MRIGVLTDTLPVPGNQYSMHGYAHAHTHNMPLNKKQQCEYTQRYTPAYIHIFNLHTTSPHAYTILLYRSRAPRVHIVAHSQQNN